MKIWDFYIFLVPSFLEMKEESKKIKTCFEPMLFFNNKKCKFNSLKKMYLFKNK